jgi:hypothetical protein
MTAGQNALSAGRNNKPKQFWDGKVAGANRTLHALAALPPDDFSNPVAAERRESTLTQSSSEALSRISIKSSVSLQRQRLPKKRNHFAISKPLGFPSCFPAFLIHKPLPHNFLLRKTLP